MKTKHEAYLREEKIFLVTSSFIKLGIALLMAFLIWGVVDLYELIKKTEDVSSVAVAFYIISSFVTGVMLSIYCNEVLNESRNRHLNSIDNINKTYGNTDNMET